jgi:hypothetical protein
MTMKERSSKSLLFITNQKRGCSRIYAEGIKLKQLFSVPYLMIKQAAAEH